MSTSLPLSRALSLSVSSLSLARSLSLSSLSLPAYVSLSRSLCTTLLINPAAARCDPHQTVVSHPIEKRPQLRPNGGAPIDYE